MIAANRIRSIGVTAMDPFAHRAASHQTIPRE
jgi:hypothetical protein